MSEETKEEKEIIEKKPEHKKTAKMFLYAFIGLLLVALVIDVFRVKKPTQLEEIDKIIPTTAQEDSQKLFDEQVGQKIKRNNYTENLSEIAGLESVPDKTTEKMRDEEIINWLNAQKLLKENTNYYQAAIQNENQQPTQTEKDAEWKAKETTRARESARAEFGFTSKTTTKPPEKKYTNFENDTNIENINQEIFAAKKRIEQIATGFPVGNQPNQSESETIGRPITENKPLPGQFLIPAGTTITAVLDQTIMSDYVGSYRGRISQDVMDIGGNNILIPKGSVSIGQSMRVSNINEPIQARMANTIETIRLPNGKKVDFKKIIGLDQSGIAALKDQVNYHFIAQFLGVAAYALLDYEAPREPTTIGTETTYEQSVGTSLRQQFAPLAARYLSLVPTITIRAGTPFKIFIEEDIYVYPWKNVSEAFYSRN